MLRKCYGWLFFRRGGGVCTDPYLGQGLFYYRVEHQNFLLYGEESEPFIRYSLLDRVENMTADKKKII